ncbi:MAG: hypothetical protein DHS20C21_21190 [Gemmatimonadota bacterium]|nr:MAG: hypothetical protein DHS20C21_21190 [Gemmatimonadota bacterium]
MRTIAYLLAVVWIAAPCWAVGPHPGDPNYTNFPSYSKMRGEAGPCEAGADEDRVAAQGEFIFEELVAAGLPSIDEPIFMVIQPGGLLTWERSLLVFSSSRKANFYAAGVLGRDEPVPLVLLTAKELCAEKATLEGDPGILSLSLDKCLACDVHVTLGLDTLDDPELLIEACTLMEALRIARANDMLDQASEAYAQGSFHEARAICRDIIDCVDVDRPEAHMLVGMSSMWLRDERGYEESLDFLGMFEGSWVADLRAMAHE